MSQPGRTECVSQLPKPLSNRFQTHAAMCSDNRGGYHCVWNDARHPPQFVQDRLICVFCEAAKFENGPIWFNSHSGSLVCKS